MKVDINASIIIPSYGYEITITTKLYPEFTFRGNVSIFVETTVPNKMIILDAAMDKINLCTVVPVRSRFTTLSNTTNYVSHFNYNQKDEKLIIHLSKPLQPNIVYNIFITFEGEIRQSVRGYVAFKYHRYASYCLT